jgi:hypothetical protein
MQIVVIGGSGLTGSKTVAIVRQGGHEVARYEEGLRQAGLPE